MLTNCPECNLQVSDKAYNCPHCGYPLKNRPVAVTQKASNRRKRLPNGFGRITKIKGRNLRKPFRAMVTIGKNAEGQPVAKLLQPVAYFETYNDAYAALVEYNRNPYDLSSDITVGELYERWSAEHFPKLSSSAAEGYRSYWNYCNSVAKIKVRDLRIKHIKYCMEHGEYEYRGKVKRTTPILQNKIKILFSTMYDYAIEYELVDKNPARNFKISSSVNDAVEAKRKSHIAFSSEELDKLWANVGTIPYADIMLIQCYSGWRPQELLQLEINRIDIENWYFTGGMKTNAGFNRTVPIHPRIRELIKTRYDEAINAGSKYLFNIRKKSSFVKIKYDCYKANFQKAIKDLALDPNHRPHDGRCTFVTLAKNSNIDEYALKYMVGHSIKDITEKIYTSRNKEWLMEEIQKIK